MQAVDGTKLSSAKPSLLLFLPHIHAVDLRTQSSKMLLCFFFQNKVRPVSQPSVLVKGNELQDRLL